MKREKKQRSKRALLTEGQTPSPSHFLNFSYFPSILILGAFSLALTNQREAACFSANQVQNLSVLRVFSRAFVFEF